MNFESYGYSTREIVLIANSAGLARLDVGAAVLQPLRRALSHPAWHGTTDSSEQGRPPRIIDTSSRTKYCALGSIEGVHCTWTGRADASVPGAG
jgi:hypothetical protein